MRIPALSGVLIGLAAAAASAQSPSSAFDRGASLQSWQAPGHAELVSACRSAKAICSSENLFFRMIGLLDMRTAIL